MIGKLSKNFHGVGIGPLSKILAVKVSNNKRVGRQMGSKKTEHGCILKTYEYIHVLFHFLFRIFSQSFWYIQLEKQNGQINLKHLTFTS